MKHYVSAMSTLYYFCSSMAHMLSVEQHNCQLGCDCFTRVIYPKLKRTFHIYKKFIIRKYIMKLYRIIIEHKNEAHSYWTCFCRNPNSNSFKLTLVDNYVTPLIAYVPYLNKNNTMLTPDCPFGILDLRLLIAPLVS
jgi:hypothetical protein